MPVYLYFFVITTPQDQLGA